MCRLVNRTAISTAPPSGVESSRAPYRPPLNIELVIQGEQNRILRDVRAVQHHLQRLDHIVTSWTPPPVPAGELNQEAWGGPAYFGVVDRQQGGVVKRDGARLRLPDVGGQARDHLPE